MARRVVVCSMDAKSERPELRHFRGDPLGEVLVNQGKYVAAVLTIIRAFLTAGLPGKPKPLGGFARWSDWVRGALMWLGETDPTDTTTAVRELDPARQRLTAVMFQWNEVIGCRPVTARQIIDEAIVLGKGEFREALLAVAGVRGNIDSRMLGKWLAEQCGRLNAGMSFGRGKLKDGNRPWVLEGGRDVPAKRSDDDDAADLRDLLR